ncbi:MAG: YqaE/Pmp3 family membrane protein [Sedimentisphaerales bacterium]|nr:YqaE/Pmp3 family membrane protein [Sedimentisphaerales bacterium]
MNSIVVIAMFWPPLAVLIEYGSGKEFMKNLLLTLFGFYPGVIHALGLVDSGKKAKYEA